MTPTRSIELKGAIFDCDGVLIDSERPWLDLMSAYLEELGATGVPAESFRGMSGAEAAAALSDVAPGQAAVPSAEEIDTAYSAALADLNAPLPGVPELITSLAGTIPIAVASNGRREDVRGLLERAGILGCFDAVVTVEDVAAGKPAPDVYLRAAAKLGLDASAATAFEDSGVGSQAAHAAGCTVIGVNTDPQTPLVADVRVSEMTQARFDPDSRSLAIEASVS